MAAAGSRRTPTTAWPNKLAGWVERDGCQLGQDEGGKPTCAGCATGARPRDPRLATQACSSTPTARTGRKQALRFAEDFAEFEVGWFEEPVSSDDLEGLRLLRDRAPPAMEIAAGEYGYEPFYFQRMLQAGAVDVLQADATRCGGVTGFLRAAAIADAYMVPLSAHTAPRASTFMSAVRCLGCGMSNGFTTMCASSGCCSTARRCREGGVIRPDLSRPGHGLELKRADAERFAA